MYEKILHYSGLDSHLLSVLSGVSINQVRSSAHTRFKGDNLHLFFYNLNLIEKQLETVKEFRKANPKSHGDYFVEAFKEKENEAL